MGMHTISFKEATDALSGQIDHAVIAKALGVSVATIRQARLSPKARAHRAPPKNWQFAVIRLAEQQIMRNRRLIEEIRKEAAPE
jgi:hypothetical protein